MIYYSKFLHHNVIMVECTLYQYLASAVYMHFLQVTNNDSNLTD
jgi:hypothetical protein